MTNRSSLATRCLARAMAPLRAQRARRIDDLRAEQGRHLASLVGDVVRHDERDAVALAPADHRERDAGVARRRLEDDRVRRGAGRARSRSSIRYLATRSLTDPVGLSISSLAKMRTSGLGDIRGISTSGVWPIASRMSVVAPAVRGERPRGRGVRVVVAACSGRGRSRRRPAAAGTAIGQPPAIAGQQTDLVAAATGVSSPAR